MKREISYKQHSFRLNVLIVCVSVIVFCSIGLSYLHYNAQMKNTPEKEMSANLVQNSAIAINYVNSERKPDQAATLVTTVILIFVFLIIFILTIQFINKRKFKSSQERMILEKERYHTILRHAHGTIWEYDNDTDVLVKSDPDVGIYSGLSHLPYFKSTMLNKKLIYEDDIPIFEQFYNDLRSGKPEIYYELRARDISGKYVWFSLSGITVYDKTNEPVSVIGQTLNIDLKKRELEELRDNSKRDALTRLYNRSATENMITEVLQSSAQSSLHAFIMIDVDDFKGINDNYGHIFGDAVLIELSAKLAKSFRGKNIIGRLGGDEFAVFLVDIPSISYVKDKADKITDIFANISIGEDGDLSVSGSLGVSIYPNDGGIFDELLQKADTALYHSKNVGKNCYHIYSPASMSTIVHALKIKDVSADSSYQQDSHSLIDSSIISNTVEILYDSRQLNVSIQMILALIGNYYDLGCLTIFEVSDDSEKLNITYEWTSDTGMGFLEHFSSAPVEHTDLYAFYRSTPHGIFYTDDISAIPQVECDLSERLRAMHIKGLLQCAIYAQEDYEGFLSANLYEDGRTWTKPEVDSIALLSKIIGAHILKLRTEKAAERIAKRDPLTNAYNFFHFMDKAGRLTEENPDHAYVVVYTDINKFKFINETFGYSEGDRVLIQFSKVLELEMDDDETFGRVSADKFTALLKYSNKSSLLNRLRQINRKMNSIKKTANDYFSLSIIIGICEVTDRSNISVHIDRANIARKSIVDRHKTTYAYFDETMKSRLLKQKEIEDIMEESLRKEDFVVYYQPKFNLSTNTICGAEALVRWNRPGVGLIAPDEFIPIFEENGFIIDIDYYVFDKVCRKIRSLLDEEKNVVPISVNFSRMHLKSRTLLPHLVSTLRDYDIPASLIEIELTESALVDDSSYLITLLNEIHDNGFKLSMDDFGSGLSSLNLLRIFPFDVLKIDKEFFQEGSSTERERIVITNVVKMASELNMSIISEGVETQEQADFLKTIHCPIAQGYFFEKPLPEDVFEEKYLKRS